jgi:hypothetical protein
MFFLPVINSDEVFYSRDTGVNWDVLFLLLGMMIIVSVVRQTGLFEYVAIWSAKRAKGSPLRIMILLLLVSALGTAVLDNVTAVLLIAPVTLRVCDRLDVNPAPFLIVEALTANIAGAATLVGDPTSIIIGTGGQLSFITFSARMPGHAEHRSSVWCPCAGRGPRREVPHRAYRFRRSRRCPQDRRASSARTPGHRHLRAAARGAAGVRDTAIHPAALCAGRSNAGRRPWRTDARPGRAESGGQDRRRRAPRLPARHAISRCARHHNQGGRGDGAGAQSAHRSHQEREVAWRDHRITPAGRGAQIFSAAPPHQLSQARAQRQDRR